MKRLLVIAAASSLLFSGCGSTPTPHLEATIQAAVAATQAAQPTNTFTAEPTETLTPQPTDTPMPTTTATATSTRVTHTPQPTAAPAVVVPIEIQAYVSEMEEHWTSIFDPLTEIGNLSGEAGGDLSRFSDPVWTLEIVTQLKLIRMAHESLLEMNVPPEMKEVHEALLNATGDCYLMTDYYASALNRISVGDTEKAIEDIEKVGKLIESCGTKTDVVVEKMIEYMAQLEN
jgi:hypothetical protein